MHFLLLIALSTSLPFLARADDIPPPSDMRLPQVLKHVLDTSPSIKAARAEFEATQELYPQAMSGWRPRIDGETSVYHSDIDNSNFGSADGTTTKDITFNIEQPVFRSFRTTAEVEESKSLIAAAEARFKRAEQSTLLAAATAYLNLVRDRNIHSLRKQNETYLETERTATQERLNAGVLTKTDLKQAESRLARAHAETIDSSAQLDASNAEFERVIGFYPMQTIYYPPADKISTAPKEALIAQAETSSPDMIAAMRAMEAAEHNKDATHSDYFPEVFAFANYNRQYDPQPGIVDETEVKTIGLRASIPLYDAGITISRNRQAASVMEQRRLEIDDTRRAVSSDLLTQLKLYHAAIAEIAARRREISAAEEARDGVKEEAKLGERTVIDVLDADQDLLDSQAALIQARRNEMVARYTISAILGTLPEL